MRKTRDDGLVFFCFSALHSVSPIKRFGDVLGQRGGNMVGRIGQLLRNGRVRAAPVAAGGGWAGGEGGQEEKEERGGEGRGHFDLDFDRGGAVHYASACVCPCGVVVTIKKRESVWALCVVRKRRGSSSREKVLFALPIV